MMITLLAETNGGQAPEQADLESWAEAPSQDLTFPVLSDPSWTISNRFEVDNGIPTYSLISRNMEILIKDGWPSASDLSNGLDEEVDDVAWNRPPDLDDPDAIAEYEGRESNVEGGDSSADSTNEGGGTTVAPAGEGRSPYGSGGGGEYPGAPYGGGACSLGASSSAGAFGLALLGGLLPGIRRRRRS